jgi:hypothetical protein
MSSSNSSEIEYQIDMAFLGIMDEATTAAASSSTQ